MKECTRREFVRLIWAAAASAGLLGAGCSGNSAQNTRRRSEPSAGQPYVAVTRGDDPAAITKAAIAALGGMGRFVRSGDDVIIKPNVVTCSSPPEFANTTNPTVVATLAMLCLGAGARRVRVMDNPWEGVPEIGYTTSGIGEAVGAAGGEMEVMNDAGFVKYAIPDGKDITEWEVYRDVVEADVLIDVPIAKEHWLTRLTLGGKNLLGVIFEAELMHDNIGQRVADLVSLVRPTLTVVDAVRVRMRQAVGWSLNDVQQTNTIVASHDIVAADAWAAGLFGLTGADIGYVKAAAEMGLGTMDLDSIKIEEISV